MEQTIQQMRDNDAPAPLMKAMVWLTNESRKTLATCKAQVASAEADRAQLINEWRAREDETKEVGEWTMEDYANAVNRGETAAVDAAGMAFAALITSGFVAWVASFWGIEAARLLPDPSGFDTASATAWAAWTAPYLGGTALLGAFAPGLLCNQGLFRGYQQQPGFYSKLQPVGLVSIAAALAYGQCIVWQGVWLQATVLWLGGGGDAQLLADPSMAGPDVGQALGGLVAMPRLPTLLVAPAAVAVASALEAGFWGSRIRLGEFGQSAFSDALEGKDGGWMVIQGPAVADGSASETDVISVDELKKALEKVQVAPMPPAEFAITAGRVFAAAAWLGAETVITGNLWFAVATAATGLLASMAVARSREGPAPPNT